MSTVIFTFLAIFYFSRLRHGGTRLPALHGLNMPDIFTKRKPFYGLFRKIISGYFYFLC
jgi:hypothetical protein